jgi:SAM-dependent methyltransferase
VLEHVADPRQHVRELERILKPGGYVIIGGPGDVYPSHRIPYNYFNIIRYGYFEMFKEFGLELVEEYFPAKSWMSILYIVYTITVRNSWFNRNQITKLIQLPILVVSFILSPVFNLFATLMDLITPFDKRVYSVYMAVLKKPVSK